MKLMSQTNFVLFGFLWVSLLSCSPSVPKLDPLPKNIQEKVDVGNIEIFDPRVDILFVVDDSGSMSAHQNNLSRNIVNFINEFKNNQILDYHIGVITSSMESLGSDQKPCCGRLVGSIKYIDSQTPNGLNILQQSLLVGINGSGQEEFFDPIYAALTSPLKENLNSGFYRDDASLAVVFITDTDDQSENLSSADFYKFLLNLKSQRKEKVLAYGVINRVRDLTVCEATDPNPPGGILEGFLNLVGNNNNFISICEPDYGTRLGQMGQDIVKNVSGTIVLTRVPDIKTVQVSYGSQIIEANAHTGWTYDASRNAIVLGNEIVWSQQPAGTKLKITFLDAKY